MAAPFGGLPTLAQYIGWASGVGCHVRYGTTFAPDGRPSRIVLLGSSDGNRWVTLVEMADTEPLVPTTIARLDRRLGLTSPFFAIDPDDPSGSC
jgi:hypothetical protein